MNPSKKTFDPVLMLGSPSGLPEFVDHLDGDATDLNAIGVAIMNAGFDGIRFLVVDKQTIAWQGLSDTPEAAVFAHLCEFARRGLQMPKIEPVLATIHALYAPERGGK